MKKWFLISSLLVVSPIFSMSRALRRGASLARRPLARTTSTSVSKPRTFASLLAGAGLLASIPALYGPGMIIERYTFYRAEQLLASMENHSPSSIAFISAVSKSNVKVIEQLLDKNNALVNATDQFGNSALTVACVRGNAEIVKALLDNGADVKEDSTPLIVTLLNGDAKIMKMLIENGANIEEIRYKDFGKLSPPNLTIKLSDRLYARRSAQVDRLVDTLDEYGADSEFRAEENPYSLSIIVYFFLSGRAYGETYGLGKKAHYTPLTVAVDEASPEIIQVLIDNGADVNKRDQDGMTPLMWASRRGHKKMVEALVARGADIEAIDNNELTARNWALRNNHIKIATMLSSLDTELGTSVNELT